jgi:uncharacterized protein YbjT (DUF2867 family)
MKLVIFGATGGTGQEVVRQSVEGGHTVTAFVRDPSRLNDENGQVKMITGNINDPEAVAEAVSGQDAVVCALGSRELKATSVRTNGTINIIQAMKDKNLKRLVVVSAMGTGESWNTLPLASKLLYATMLRSARIDHESQEAAVRESGLDWTTIRPSGLTDSPKTGEYQFGENIKTDSSSISRADVADLILKSLEDSSLIGNALTISS